MTKSMQKGVAALFEALSADNKTAVKQEIDYSFNSQKPVVLSFWDKELNLSALGKLPADKGYDVATITVEKSSGFLNARIMLVESKTNG